MNCCWTIVLRRCYQASSGFAERMAWKAWKQASLSRTLMNTGNGKLKNWVVNKLFTGWSRHRSALNFPAKTFNEQWKEKSRA